MKKSDFRKTIRKLVKEEYQNVKLRQVIREEVKKVLKEQEKWSKGVDVEAGKMHRVLNVPEDEKIIDHYTSGAELARDLIDAVGRDEAASMLAFVANVDPAENVFDDALSAMGEGEV